MMPGITEEIFCRAVDIDYTALYNFGKFVLNLLHKKEMRVTTELGTDISFSLKPRHIAFWGEGTTRAEIDSGNIKKIGAAGNIPAGEVYWEPVDYKTFNGRIVVDGAFGKYEKPGKLNSGVSYEVKEGKVVIGSITGIDLKSGKDIGLGSGSEAAKWFKKFVQKHKDASVMYEFGVGINPNALIKDDTNLLESEKASGTVHFAQGATNHNDGLVLNPTIYANGTQVMRGNYEEQGWEFDFPDIKIDKIEKRA